LICGDRKRHIDALKFLCTFFLAPWASRQQQPAGYLYLICTGKNIHSIFWEVGFNLGLGAIYGQCLKLREWWFECLAGSLSHCFSVELLDLDGYIRAGCLGKLVL
jgi:hypothetical protein